MLLRSPGRAMRGYARAAVLALAVVALLRGCVAQGVRVHAGSMLPALQMGDHVLVSQLFYGLPLPFDGLLWRFAAPRRGDVVLFAYADEAERDYIKRVVAVAGDLVEIRDRRLLVDGAPADLGGEYFADSEQGVQSLGARDNFGPFRVPPDHVFVLGDNRDRSVDSRNYGPAALEGIKGKAFFIYWSQDDFDGSVRWERLGAGID